MAAVNGCGPAQFATEMGFSIKRILDLEPWSLDKLCQLAGLNQAERDELVSWTGESVGNVRTLLRNEVFVSRAVRNPTVKGCPACLREDAAGEARPMKFMFIRGDWQVRGKDVCLRHNMALVPLWTHEVRISRYSISDRLSENLEDILSGSRDGARMSPSEYDLWLDRRLQDGADTTWLGALGLYPAITFCELLGAELVRAGGAVASAQVRPSVAGFLVARNGPGKIEEALDGLLAATGDTALEPRGVYGQLFTYLDRASCGDPAFDALRDLLRSHIFRRWPLGPDDKIFGQSLTARRIHSVATASKEIGVGHALLDSLLTEAGAFEPHDQRAPRQKTFEPAPFSELLKEIPSWIGPIEMQKAMGATRAELRALEEDKVLIPRTSITTVKSPWRASDGEVLLERLRKMTRRQVSSSEKGWITLQAARNHSQLSLAEILRAVEAAALTMGRNVDDDGYHSFVVMKDELDRLAPHDDTSSQERDLVPAAAFGREIGLRGSGTFLSFISDGHTPAQRAPHPMTGQLLYYLSQEDIAEFRRRFLTPSMMAAETGAHRNTVIAALTSHGAQRFMPGGKDYGAIYLRVSVASALASLRD